MVTHLEMSGDENMNLLKAIDKNKEDSSKFKFDMKVWYDRKR